MHQLQSGAIPTRGGAALPAMATASSVAECQRSRRAGCADRSGAAPVMTVASTVLTASVTALC